MAGSTVTQQTEPDPFQIALNDFTRRLTDQEVQKFKCATIKDVEITLAQIQDRQESKRELRNLTRIGGFLCAVDQLSKILELFTNSSNMVAFIWGPLKLILLMSSNWASTLDQILDAYEQIGETLPLLKQYESFFKRHSEMRDILVMIYRDILEFHRPAIRFFDHPGMPTLCVARSP